MQEEIPDFGMTVRKANEILLCASSIKSFPFSIESVIEEMSDIELVPFSEIEGGGLSARQVVGSDDAAIVESDGQYIIFYNGRVVPSREKFSKGHEFAHYYCGHDIERITELRKANDARFSALYSKYEVEANFFSAQLLMPEQILIELAKRGKKVDERFLVEAFGVSPDAAKKRMRTLRKFYAWNERKRWRDDGASLDDCVIEKFRAFTDSVAPLRYSYTYSLERDLEMESERQGWQ